MKAKPIKLTPKIKAIIQSSDDELEVQRLEDEFRRKHLRNNAPTIEQGRALQSID